MGKMKAIARKFDASIFIDTFVLIQCFIAMASVLSIRVLSSILGASYSTDWLVIMLVCVSFSSIMIILDRDKLVKCRLNINANVVGMKTITGSFYVALMVADK